MMKSFKKLVLPLIGLTFALVFCPNFSQAADTEVNNQDSLVSAIETANNGDVINLSEDIVLISPVSVTGKNITINGNGHSIYRIDTNWTPNGADGSLITAGGAGTKLTLSNITLKDAHKYGLQSYNGAYVVLDGVTLSNNGFGGALVNAGTIEIRKVTLTKNGQYGNNGIEIGKGDVTGDNVPTIIMNGTISSTETENVIYIAENDNLSEFSVKNTDGSEDKIFVSGNKVVVTDKENNVLYSSNDYAGLKISGDNYVPNDNTDNEPEKTPDQKDDTPKTGTENLLQLSILIFAVSIILLVSIRRKDF